MGRQHSCVTKQMLHAPHTQDAQNANWGAEVFQFCAISRLVNWQKCMAQVNSTNLSVARLMIKLVSVCTCRCRCRASRICWRPRRRGCQTGSCPRWHACKIRQKMMMESPRKRSSSRLFWHYLKGLEMSFTWSTLNLSRLSRVSGVL